MDRQRRCCKGPCHDVFFREAPWGASARRSKHPSSSRFSRYTVSWRPSTSTVAWAYSNECSRSSPLGRTTTTCRSGCASRMSWRTSLKHPGDRLAVNAGNIWTSAIAASHCTCILSLARMYCVGILAAWTTAAPVLAPTLPIHPLARLPTFGSAKRTQVLIQDRCRRQVSRQGAVRRQGVQTVGCSVLGRRAEPLVRTQFPEHPPSLNFGANHLKNRFTTLKTPPVPFLSPHNPHHRGGFFWGGLKS